MDNNELLPVRVALRVRPLNEKEKSEGSSQCIKCICEKQQIIIGSNKAFTFDNIFSPESTQEKIFHECVEPLIDYCFQGYNTTILAYGQTGSGKTYTMGTGNNQTIPKEQLGIVPRVIDYIFEKLKNNTQSNKNFNLSVSFMELYNEEIKDMLQQSNNSKSLTIHEGLHGVYVNGLTELKVETKEEMENALITGSLYRTVGSTQMNLESSRSHAIFSILIKQTNKNNDTMDIIESKFHFVDLAGSERLSKTKSVGVRMKEGIHINSGLLALGNVISALADEKKKNKHIPYRDSKLTRVLQDSLGGNSRTLMIACISPAHTNFEETLNTLKYADRVKSIKNKPVVNIDPIKLELETLRKQVQLLQRELSKYKNGNISFQENNILFTEKENALSSSQQELVSGLLERVKRLEYENQCLEVSLKNTERKSTILMNLCIKMKILVELKLSGDSKNYEEEVLQIYSTNQNYKATLQDKIEQEISNIIEEEDNKIRMLAEEEFRKKIEQQKQLRLSKSTDELNSSSAKTSVPLQEMSNSANSLEQTDDLLMYQADQLLNGTTSYNINDFDDLFSKADALIDENIYNIEFDDELISQAEELLKNTTININ